MKVRDEKGRFKKENNDSEFTIRIPFIKNIIFYINLLVLYLQRLIIISYLIA